MKALTKNLLAVDYDALTLGATLMRYQIYPIADADCASVQPHLLAESDDATEATRLASSHSNRAFGAAILDTDTGLYDFGSGFGAPVPDADEE